MAGTYAGASIGYDNNSVYTDMIFMDAGKLGGNPAWSSVTLTADSGPDTVTIDRNYPTSDIGAKDPTRFESLTSNIDRSGLFRLPLGAPAMVGMTIEDITIELHGGTSIVGSQGAGVQEWTFNNVDLFLESHQTATAYLSGGGSGVPGRSALFSHHSGDAALTGSFFDFNNSRIYVDPNTDEAFKTDGMFVGYRWTDLQFPDGFFDGNNTSEILLWTTGAAVTGLEPEYTGTIWSSTRTGGAGLVAYTDTGGVQSGGFLVNFNGIAAPTIGPETVIQFK